MNVPTLPNEIIFKILNHRKDIKYLDRKYEEQQKHKINLLNWIFKLTIWKCYYRICLIIVMNMKKKN